MRSSVAFKRVWRAAAVVGAAGGLTVGGVSASYAQAASHPVTTDARWTPWLGCWQADAARSTGGTVNAGLTCNIPVAGSVAIQSLAIVDGKVVSRHRLDASGPSHPLDEGGCKGSESAAWATGGERVYLRGHYTCSGGLGGSSTSILAMTPGGDWLEVQGVHADGGSADRVMRWRDAGLPSGLPKEVTTALSGRTLAVTTARAAASRPIRSDDVIDAVRSVDSSTVRSWLAEIGQRFSLGGPDLLALERENVPSSVLRAMMGDFGSDASLYSAQAQQSADEYFRNNAPVNYAAVAGYDPMFENPYSPYNGYAPYAPYGVAPVVGYPFYGGVVVVRGGFQNRRDERGHEFGGRPPEGRPTGAVPHPVPPPHAAPHGKP